MSVQVGVRVRPFNSREIKLSSKCIISMPGENQTRIKDEKDKEKSDSEEEEDEIESKNKLNKLDKQEEDSKNNKQETKSTSNNKSQTGEYGPLIGQIIGSIKDCCRKAFICAEPRLYEANYLCVFQINQDLVGKIYSVFSKRRGEIINEIPNCNNMMRNYQQSGDRKAFETIRNIIS